jgi:peptidylprolyl isomerase
MRLNEGKRITIKAEDAYGKKNDALTKEFPLSTFPEDFTPEEGMVIKLQDQTGRAIPGTITAIAENSITVDLNHPLAGKELTFDIKVVAIN